MESIGLGFGLAQTSLQAAEHLLSRDCFCFPRPDFLYAALDLCVPRCLDALVGGFIIKAFHQAINQQAALFSGKGKRLLQKLGYLWRHWRQDHLAMLILHPVLALEAAREGLRFDGDCLSFQ